MLSDVTRTRARDRALALADEVAAVPNVAWRGIAGCAGDALLHWAALQATGEAVFERAMHASLQRAVRFEDGAQLGLFTGIAGLRASAEFATDIEARYGKIVAQCDNQLALRAPDASIRPRVFYDFDVIAGWAGVRIASGMSAPYDAYLNALLALVSDWDRWKVPHPDDKERIPVHDMGLAHGVAGILSCLALTYSDVQHAHRQTILACAYRLLDCRREGPGVTAWPHSLEHEDAGDYRAAWCYGACGVTAALYAVGVAFNDDALRDRARAIARECAGAGVEAWRVRELGICHGIIGNVLCFASVLGNEAAPVIESLVTRTLDELDETGGRCWGYREDERYAATDELMGAAGVALALLTVAGDAPSGWMRLHGLMPL